MDVPGPYGVIAAPNASRLRGKLLSIKPGPGGQGSTLELKVEEAHDVGELANFAKGRVGEVISVLVPPGTKHKFKAKDQVELQVKFEGDARGGEFFLSEGKARKL